MNKTPQNHMIAIVGGSGAGKGWLVERLRRLLGERACHLPIDNFYRDRTNVVPGRRGSLNFDTPSAIDWARAEQAMRNCRDGRIARVPRYDFLAHRRLARATTLEPTPLVIVDGLSLLVHPPVRHLFDLKIYLDCPPGLRLRRRLASDVAERGRSAATVKRQFRSTVAPMHARFVEPQRQWADVILAQPFRKPDLILLADRLWALLSAASPLKEWMRVPFRSELLNLLEYHENPT